MGAGISFNSENCLDFWANKPIQHPLISFWVGTFSIPDLYPNCMKLLPDGPLSAKDIDLELCRMDYESLFEKNLETMSDTPWSAFPLMTIPWVEAILGCPINKNGINIWAESPDENLEQFLSRSIDLDNNAWLQKLLEFTQWLVDLSASRFPVSVSLMRGPSDLLSALRGPSQMCLDFYDSPDLVLKVMEKLTDLWIKIAHRQMALIPPFMEGFGFGQIYLWGLKKCAWFQDDAVALLSPKHYRRFLLPFEETIAASLPASGIHLHPQSLFVVDDLITIPDLDVIEINYEPTGPTLKDLLPCIQKIVAEKCLVLWGDFSEEDLSLLKQNVSTGNLCLQINVDFAQSAQSKLALVKKIWNN